jgi:hypothetical protein
LRSTSSKVKPSRGLSLVIANSACARRFLADWLGGRVDKKPVGKDETRAGSE